MDDSHQYLRAMFDHTQTALLLADNQGRYIDANPAAVAMLGYVREELLRMSLADLTPRDHLKSGAREWDEFLNEGRASGGYRLMRKDGATLDIEFRAVANIVPGVHLSAFTDVTERK